MNRQSGVLVTIDVGNTTTSYAVCSIPLKSKDPIFKKQGVISTEVLRSHSRQKNKLYAMLLRLKKSHRNVFVVISNVVPTAQRRLRRMVRMLFKRNPLFITARLKGRLKVRYKNPSEVGSDRLANARGSLSIAHGPIVVVDFGTATTFDCVSKRDEYLGGVIAPGPVLSAHALYERTAKLPYVPLKKPAPILGRNTRESIEAGLYHGYRGLIKEILTSLKKKMGSRTKVYATGGDVRWVTHGLKNVDRIVPNLTHIGLVHTWLDLNRKKTK